MDGSNYSSQVQEWIRSAMESRGMDAEKTIRCCEKIEDYARKNKDEALLGFAYYYKGESYYIQNNVDKLFENVSRALAYLDRTGQWELLARGYNILAITSVSRGNAPFAMDYYLNALSYCKRYQMEDIGIIVNMNIGSLYNWLGEYNQAQHFFDRGYQMLQKKKDVPDYYSYLLIFYMGVGNTYLYREVPSKALFYEEKAAKECLNKVRVAERLAFYGYQARLYNSIGQTEKRDESIGEIRKLITQPIEILSVFDDLYMYCEMLFQIAKYDDFKIILDVLEQLAISAKITHIQKKLLTLKIKYHKIAGETEECRDACACYFELSELMESESRYTVMSMINIRNFLEESTKQLQRVEEQNRILQERSETDPLTGLANRFRLNTYAENAFLRAAVQKEPLAVEILDIDYFKQYNDNYGHQAGDRCIQKIAGVISSLASEHQIFCARYGGDEFILIYEGYNREYVKQLAERLKKNIMQLGIEHKFSKIMPIVTISQEICHDTPQDESKLWDFLHTADSMLYRVKENQRNNVSISSFEEE